MHSTPTFEGFSLAHLMSSIVAARADWFTPNRRVRDVAARRLRRLIQSLKTLTESEIDASELFGNIDSNMPGRVAVTHAEARALLDARGLEPEEADRIIQAAQSPHQIIRPGKAGQ